MESVAENATSAFDDAVEDVVVVVTSEEDEGEVSRWTRLAREKNHRLAATTDSQNFPFPPFPFLEDFLFLIV